MPLRSLLLHREGAPGVLYRRRPMGEVNAMLIWLAILEDDDAIWAIPEPAFRAGKSHPIHHPRLGAVDAYVMTRRL